MIIHTHTYIGRSHYNSERTSHRPFPSFESTADRSSHPSTHTQAAEDRIHDLTHQLDLLNKPKLKLKASPSPPPQYQGLTEAQVEALTQRQRRDLSVTLTALRHQQRDAERRMLRLWAQALAMKPDDPEIKTHVQAKFNPYLGRQVTA